MAQATCQRGDSWKHAVQQAQPNMMQADPDGHDGPPHTSTNEHAHTKFPVERRHLALLPSQFAPLCCHSPAAQEHRRQKGRRA